MRKGRRGLQGKNPGRPTFFWLCEVSCAWPTALALILPVSVYFTSSHQLWKQSRGLLHAINMELWKPCWLAENIPGLMTVLKTWALQIRDITGASTVLLLQNLFEYFSILSYLHVSKPNPSLKSPSKCSSQTLFWNHKGKKPNACRDRLKRLLQTIHPLKVQKDLVKN